jgi:hypothetical protein
VLPFTDRFMRLDARALVLALVPSLVAAQSNVRFPAAQQGGGAAHPVLEQDALPPTAGRVPAATRVLVVECPASPSGAAATPSDSVTQALVAALCARARTGSPVRELARMLVPRADSTHAHASRNDAHAHDEAPLDDLALPLEPQFRVHLFGDVKFSAVDSLGSRNGFALGQFDIFGRSQLSEDLSVLTEATLTALPRNTFNARLERLLLTFAPNDYFVASAGRYHTSIGYYNSGYHHGSWFQTAIGRPLVFAIDGDIGLLPSHTLGVSASGDVPSGALGLRYLAELGSGRASQSSAALASQPALVDNNTPSINVGLMVRPDRFDGLQVGATLYRDRLTLQDTSKAPIDEMVGAAYALYKTDVVELLGEWTTLHHRSRRTGDANSSRGYYAQASRRFRDVRPYVRYDYVDVPTSNQLFGFLGRRSGPTVGIRYDFDALAAVKLQTSHLNQTTRPTMNRVDAQVSFMF